MPAQLPVPAGVMPRLVADFTVRRSDFSLRVRLDVGAEILVLFGPSGSGKSTTLNAIAGLIEPQHGRITLDGETLFLKMGSRGPSTSPRGGATWATSSSSMPCSPI